MAAPLAVAGGVAVWAYRGYKAAKFIYAAYNYYDDYKNPVDWRFQYMTPAINDGVVYYH